MSLSNGSLHTLIVPIIWHGGSTSCGTGHELSAELVGFVDFPNDAAVE